MGPPGVFTLNYRLSVTQVFSATSESVFAVSQHKEAACSSVDVVKSP